MITNNQEIGDNTGKYAIWSIVPETLHKELYSFSSAGQDSVTPSTDKKIRVHSINVTSRVLSAPLSVTASSVSFGTNGLGTPNKVLWSGTILTKDDHCELYLGNLNVVGAINETVTLTNGTYAGLFVIETRAIIYYTEE